MMAAKDEGQMRNQMLRMQSGRDFQLSPRQLKEGSTKIRADCLTALWVLFFCLMFILPSCGSYWGYSGYYPYGRYYPYDYSYPYYYYPYYSYPGGYYYYPYRYRDKDDHRRKRPERRIERPTRPERRMERPVQRPMLREPLRTPTSPPGGSGGFRFDGFRGGGRGIRR